MEKQSIYTSIKNSRWLAPLTFGVVLSGLVWAFSENPLNINNNAFADNNTPAYVGSKKCKKCHSKMYKAFSKKKMAKTLEKLKEEEYYDIERVTDSGKYCAECHTTGFGKQGGFPETKEKLEKILETQGHKKLIESVGHVGCEECHGPGGEHTQFKKSELRKRAKEGKDLFINRFLSNNCVECHNPHVSHKPGEEVNGQWSEDRGPTTTIEDATYIGAETCKGCHDQQYQTWSKTKHATAFSVLKKEEYSKKDDARDIKLTKPPKDRLCIECHVTGYDKGGFKDVNEEESQKFLNVQCEACHGPGSTHKEAAEKYKKDGKDFTKVEDKKMNRVPQNACKECHHNHISHKSKYSGRRDK